MPTYKFREYHLEKLQDKEEARLYLEVALEEYESDGDTQAFFQALKDVTDAQGGMTHLVQKTHLSRQNLYRVMSGEHFSKVRPADLTLCPGGL